MTKQLVKFTQWCLETFPPVAIKNTRDMREWNAIGEEVTSFTHIEELPSYLRDY